MSAKSVFIAIFIISAVAAILWTAMRFWLQPQSSDPIAISSAGPTVAPKQVLPVPDFTITALQIAADDRRVINCVKNNCQALPPVNAAITDAVTDGQSWYHYQETEEEKTAANKVQLRRTWINQNKSDLVIEQTPLVKPRELYISPDSKKVAFWLDNISEPAKQLTELWLYDADSASTKLIAEKIQADSVLTQPRWNRASTHLWFLGATVSPEKKPATALHVISIQPPSVTIQFSNIDWTYLLPVVNTEPMDLSPSGQAIAYVEPQNNKTILHFQAANSTMDATTISGSIPYIQWLSDDTLLYVVQSRFSFTFWQARDAVHKRLAKNQGVFQSARADATGQYVLFNTQPSAQISHAYALEVATGRISYQSFLPRFGDQNFLIHFQLNDSGNQTADITAPIDDEQIAAFLDKNIASIAEADAQPQRFITTDQLNTIWLDYSISQNKKRLLLTIKDANHAEWSISARYRESAGEWLSEQGNLVKTPQPARVYEWEQGPRQWILKENLSN